MRTIEDLFGPQTFSWTKCFWSLQQICQNVNAILTLITYVTNEHPHNSLIRWGMCARVVLLNWKKDKGLCAWSCSQGVASSCHHPVLGLGVDEDAWHATVAWGPWPDHSVQGRLGGAWHRGGGWGEIVLIRKLPAARDDHPSSGRTLSHGQLLSRQGMSNWSRYS